MEPDTRDGRAIERARDAIARRLVGSSFVRFGYADWWALETDGGTWLLAQTLVPSTGGAIAELLRRHRPALLDSIDVGLVPAAAGLAGLLRRPVLDVAIGTDGSLEVVCAHGSLRATTDAPIVDWQWSVAREPADPYRSFEVACFWRGEVRIAAEPT